MSLNDKSFEKMFFSIFNPKKNEKILLVYDKPTNKINDNIKWKERRELIKKWYEYLLKLGKGKGFFVTLDSFSSIGENNKLLNIKNRLHFSKYNIIIAMTEFSITTTLVRLAREYPDTIRCASMPLAEERMEKTVFNIDYSNVKKYAKNIKILLQESNSATIYFSTDDFLIIDLRNRIAGVDDGDCTKPGKIINLPSGEGFIAPYEGVDDEKKEYNKSKTKGILPLMYKNQIIKAVVEENNIIAFNGPVDLINELNDFFEKHPFRRNIAELGIGCNPKATVSGNFIEDEKVGFHIAYGTSSHIGGKITSDIHKDIVYAKGCPIEAEKVILHQKNKDIVIIKDSMVQYDLLNR
jgi:leucyl aminopeptidase (aminopeptidase T)